MMSWPVADLDRRDETQPDGVGDHAAASPMRFGEGAGFR
jgi:hypothetical protein